MKENSRKMHEIINPNKPSCGVCREVSRIYSRSADDAVYSLPETVGKGYLKRLVVDKATQVTLYDFTFNEGIIMEETALDESFKLSFCLEEAFEWYSESKHKVLYMGKNESCIFPGGFMHSTGIYNQDVRYRGVGISLHPDKYQSVLEYFNSANAVTDLKKDPGLFRTYRITPAVKGIVQQIISCAYSGSLRNMYIEGKILELAAVYINEVLAEKSKERAGIRLSRQDIEGLGIVKALLDNNFTAPMTLSELARAAYINEYKLKQGFKALYGQSVYSYVIDKRMDTARQLFEERDMKIKDVAGSVGYTNISHFIEAFRKRFGVTPGAYLKNIE